MLSLFVTFVVGKSISAPSFNFQGIFELFLVPAGWQDEV